MSGLATGLFLKHDFRKAVEDFRMEICSTLRKITGSL